MSNHPRKNIGNAEINKGSILLLFNERDTKIVRDWRHVPEPDEVVDPGDSLSP